MKKQAILAAVVALLAAVGTGLAQNPSGPPKPGPEHQKLAYFAGKWTSVGDTKASAYGPGGKYTGTETCEWLDGKFALVCHSEVKFSESTFTGLAVMGYAAAGKNYTYFETNSLGENVFSRGRVDGATWTWEYESVMGDKPFRGRFTLKQLSPDIASYKVEVATGSDPLALVMEGKQTRQK